MKHQWWKQVFHIAVKMMKFLSKFIANLFKLKTIIPREQINNWPDIWYMYVGVELVSTNIMYTLFDIVSMQQCKSCFNEIWSCLEKIFYLFLLSLKVVEYLITSILCSFFILKDKLRLRSTILQNQKYIPNPHLLNIFRKYSTNDAGIITFKMNA